MDGADVWTKWGTIFGGAALGLPIVGWGLRRILQRAVDARRHRREIRDRAAEYLERISVMLDEMAADFEKHEASPARCTELSVALKHIQYVLQETGIGRSTADTLLLSLSHVEEAPGFAFRGIEQEKARRLVWHIRAFLDTDGKDEPVDIEAEIVKMREASGLFRGSAAAMRALN